MATTAPKALPHQWATIYDLASLQSTANITSLILSKPFIDRWVTFRDSIPLSPGMTLSNFTLHSKDWIDKLASNIYREMDATCHCKYDDPSASDRASWKTMEHFQCLIYQSARHLAKPGKVFFTPFERKSLNKEGGKVNAIKVLKGLIMIAHNLVFNYIFLAPSHVVTRIEELRPTPDPAKSPIPRVRLEHKLMHVDVGELKERILRPEGEGSGEKEWLIGLIAQNPELVQRVLSGGTGAGLKVEEDGGGEAKEKRKREEIIEVDDDPIITKEKKIKTG